jgi:hypothetical protein
VADVVEPRTMTVVPAWIEAHCVVPDGFRRGAPMQLYDYQLRYTANFYMVRGDAVWVPDNPVLAPAFVNRRALLVGPQKVGKNPLIASHVCVEGVGPSLFAGWTGSDDGYACRDWGCRCGWEYPYESGEPMGMPRPTPLIQITAFSKKATDNTYDALRPMIDLGPLSDLIPKTGEEFIRLPGGGRIDTVTSGALSKLGNPVTYAPQDEVGVYTRLNKMEKVADTQWRGLAGMGGRASCTTNMWDSAENSVAQQMFESPATDIYRQLTRPPKSLSFDNKAERRKIFRIVYPADVLRENGGHLDLDGIEAETAELIIRDAAQAKRFYGNIEVAGAGTAVDPERWDELERAIAVASGSVIGLGFDGSNYEDATFLRGCTAEGHGFLVDAWIRPTTDAEMALWLAAHKNETEWRVIREEVNAAVDEAFARFRVGLLLIDPPKWWTEGEAWQKKHGGKERVEFFDTNQAHIFAPAVGRWRTAITEGTHTHDGDPATTAHVKAAHLRKVRLTDDDADGATKYVLVKGSDRRKIDGAVADVLAYEAAKTMTPPPPLVEPWVIVR